ncbi:O-antigen biosynthesis glycosyltransferase WbnJ [Thomasclavelia cocleata]|uniref:O-antigen biosynthesis glycosyltransferase WbnJ n=1 Tax=Thomasclavelia cocleata TaxID=69824 RepID=A0A829ZDL9_9FIRM|nr:glycosyltransferase [Thomasclavelia cocleata]GFI41084.1 O-antigen biosynthesis glycosyltransferase WbnJ [Thomasclavelia cocleata]
MCLVSVIMSTYKEEEIFLRQAIESILDQTYKDFEYIIILDNPDNDLHIKIIEEYTNIDKRIKFYINKKNIGLTASLNKGLGLAKGIYICRMDADDISISNRIENQKKYLEENKYDLIGGISQMIDENGESIYSIKKVPTDINKIKKALRYNQIISHPTWFGKKEVFDKLNGYRNMPLCEDYDFTLRAVLNGYKISNINETILKYRMTSSSISRSNLYEQYLFARFITKKYSEKEIADIDKAKEYVNNYNNYSRAKRYLKANERFNIVLKDIEEKKYLKFIKDGFLLTFTSKSYLNKIYRFFMVTINS